MTRLAGSFFLLVAFLVPLGCGNKGSKDDNLVLTLPESKDPPKHAPDRISHLTIDGKKYDEPRKTWRSLKVEPEKGKDTVTVEYTFWPNTYTKVIRTKQVKIESGKKTEVDLTKEDENDKVQPIFFPTPDGVVDAMCKLGKVGKGDVVYDIGCGDGRMVIRAVKQYEAKKGVGIDIDADLVKKCQENAKAAGVADQVEFKAQDCQEIKDFSEANVVLVYLSEELMVKIKPTLEKTLKPGARIVSHRFTFGKGWAPDESKTINAINNYGDKEDYTLHLWNIK